MSAIDNALYNAFGQRMISIIYTQANQYRVILEHGVEGGVGLAALNNIRLRSNQNTMVPLTILAKVEQSYGPLSINHLDQFPSATFSFNVAKGSSLEGAVNTIKQIENQLKLPHDIITQFQGATLPFEKALANTLWLILAAIITMYIVLGILYESFIHPITILSTYCWRWRAISFNDSRL